MSFVVTPIGLYRSSRTGRPRSIQTSEMLNGLGSSGSIRSGKESMTKRAGRTSSRVQSKSRPSRHVLGRTCSLKSTFASCLLIPGTMLTRIGNITRMPLAELKSLVREVPNFPKPGIIFRDITPLLREPLAFAEVIHLMAAFAQKQSAEVIAAPESRGFIFGAAMAIQTGMGFVPIRKPGKLPWKTRGASYALEYGIDNLEIHEDAIRPGQRVLMVDDVLATGGTMKACCDLVTAMDARIAGVTFLIELAALGGR